MKSLQALSIVPCAAKQFQTHLVIFLVIARITHTHQPHNENFFMTYQKQKGSFSRGKKLNFEFLKFLFRRISFRIQAISIVLLAECYNPLPDMKPLPRCKFKEKKVFLKRKKFVFKYRAQHENCNWIKFKEFTCIHFPTYPVLLSLLSKLCERNIKLFRLPRIYCIFPFYPVALLSFSTTFFISLGSTCSLEVLFSSCKLKFHKQAFKEKPPGGTIVEQRINKAQASHSLSLDSCLI